MARPITPKESYAVRLNRVVDYIDTHLSEPLRLEELASQAAFSPFHFHRLFRAWFGETLQDFVRRRRLESAASQLKYAPHHSIGHIALEAGFNSAEGFARAFRRHFDMSPSAWRNGGAATWGDQVRAPSDRNGLVEERTYSVLAERVRVVVLPEVQVAYQRAMGPYNETVRPLWGRFSSWYGALGLENETCYGMGLDDPSITPAEHRRYDACITIPAGTRLPTKTPVKVIAGGPHAILDYEGSPMDVGAGWIALFADWLPSSGFEVIDHPCMDRFSAGLPKFDAPNFRCELCVPLYSL